MPLRSSQRRRRLGRYGSIRSNSADSDKPIADLIAAVKLPNTEPSTRRGRCRGTRLFARLVGRRSRSFSISAIASQSSSALRSGRSRWKSGYATTAIDRLASFRTIGLHVDEFQVDPKRMATAIRKAVKNAIEIDKAEAIILRCAIEFGFYAELQKEFGIPVIDAVYACYKETEHAALNKIHFGWKPCRLYSMAAPDPAGLGASGIFADDPPIENRILVPRTCIRLVGLGEPGSK